MKKLFIAAVISISSVSAYCATATVRYDLTAMLDTEILNFMGVPGDDMWMAASDICEGSRKCIADRMNNTLASRKVALPIADNYMQKRGFELLGHQCPSATGCIDVYAEQKSHMVVKVISYCPGACHVQSLTSFKN